MRVEANVAIKVLISPSRQDLPELGKRVKQLLIGGNGANLIIEPIGAHGPVKAAEYHTTYRLFTFNFLLFTELSRLDRRFKRIGHAG